LRFFIIWLFLNDSRNPKRPIFVNHFENPDKNSLMKIAIIGYGRMGKMIEEAAVAKGHTIGLIIDLNNQADLTVQNLAGHDVAIEFTTPSSASQNISVCFDADMPVVSGTTGWLDRVPEIKERCLRENHAIVYSSNFSIGVNILFHINSHLAKLIEPFDKYKPRIEEIHHIKKLDAPSGTAISLAQQVMNEIKKLKNWKLTDTPDSHTLPIKAIRADDITGIHEVIYESDVDTISIRHSAKNRKGFVHGVIMAAEFIVNKKGFFTMEDVLRLK
jgi:4-hydroxy-tetrahydrodipicolinate reductase